MVLNYLIPENVFASSLHQLQRLRTVWVWLMILLSQVAMRRKLSTAEIKALDFPVFGWPYAPAFAIGFYGVHFSDDGLLPRLASCNLCRNHLAALLTMPYRIWVKPEQSLGKESEPCPAKHRNGKLTNQLPNSFTVGQFRG